MTHLSKVFFHFSSLYECSLSDITLFFDKMFADCGAFDAVIKTGYIKVRVKLTENLKTIDEKELWEEGF